MSIEVSMPKLSDTMEEGTILKWHIKPGDRVARGDIIAEVETDKAAMEMEAFDDGVVAELKVNEGDTVAVGSVLAVLETAAADWERAEEIEVLEESDRSDESGLSEQPEPPAAPSEKPPTAAVSPAARQLAREKGVNIDHIRGSGPGGRIVLADVERAISEPLPPAEAEPPPAASGAKKSVKIRRIVARKMVESWQNIPHFFVTVAVDMTDIIRFRKDLGVSVNDFILAAAARSLQEHPWVNSHWVEGEAVEQPQVNISMAVASDRGLYNPVIRDCADLSLKEISRRAAELADRAHRGQLQTGDLEGGTFTISNMGMLGVESFSAIITPPQAAVLAVGTIRGEVIVDEKGEPGIAPMLRLTLSADHRILDGADAAEFLATLKSYLEAPVTLVTCNYGKEEG